MRVNTQTVCLRFSRHFTSYCQKFNLVSIIPLPETGKSTWSSRTLHEPKTLRRQTRGCIRRGTCVGRKVCTTIRPHVLWLLYDFRRYYAASSLANTVNLDLVKVLPYPSDYDLDLNCNLPWQFSSWMKYPSLSARREHIRDYASVVQLEELDRWLEQSAYCLWRIVWGGSTGRNETRRTFVRVSQTRCQFGSM